MISPEHHISETLTFGGSGFCDMVDLSSPFAQLAGQNVDLISEATRLLVSSCRLKDPTDREAIIQAIVTAIYRDSLLSGRPFLMAVIQPALYRRLKGIGGDIKIVGRKLFPPRNKLEIERYGQCVPHFAIVLNALSSEPNIPGYFFEEIQDQGILRFSDRNKEFQQRVQRIWEQISEQ